MKACYKAKELALDFDKNIKSYKMSIKDAERFERARIEKKISEINEERNLINATKEILAFWIKQCKAGNKIGYIGNAIDKYVSALGYSVVYEFCGHGVGLKFHEEPEVGHCRTEDLGPEMVPGMIFTIEK